MKLSKGLRLSRLLLVVALISAVASLSVVDTAGAAPSSTTWYVNAGVENHNHAIQGMAFLPGEIWIHQGDAIVWTATSGEPHSVTFVPTDQASLPPLFPCILTRTQKVAFDNAAFDACQSVAFLNSGVLTNLPLTLGLPAFTSFNLTFTTIGTFTYFCMIHHAPQTAVPGMQGVVHVVAVGEPLPFTQRDYDQQSAAPRQHLIEQGHALMAQTLANATTTSVAVGAGTDMVDIMRFMQQQVTIHVGQQITFTNQSMGAPHTVTFGTEQCGGQCPYGDPTNYMGGDLNSGLFFGGQSFHITFNKPGTYSYFCALHDFLGMVGTVKVVPAEVAIEGHN